jgi:outer membrane protein assembly factor BamB
MKKLVLTILCPVLLLSACDAFKQKKEVLQGERELVLLQSTMSSDSEKKDIAVHIPLASASSKWPQSGGHANHIVAPALLNEDLKVSWDRSVGGGDSTHYILAEPVISDGHVYVLNAYGDVSSFNIENGDLIWRASIVPAGYGASSFGGGLAIENDVLYVTTPYAEVIAMEIGSGNVLWRKEMNSPLRAAPTVYQGRVYAISISNELYTLDVHNGDILWTHNGVMESAGILGGASPAAKDNVVIVPYSSGEVYALRTENGYPLWSESLASYRRVDSVSALPHVRARPAIDGDTAYVVSHSGRMAAMDIRTGQVIWGRDIGGIQSPAVCGNVVYVVTSQNQLVALSKENGAIVWSTELPQHKNAEKKSGKIVWAGPLLANSDLILTGSNGALLTVSAQSGEILAEKRLPGPAFVSPIAADQTLFVLTEKGRLVAMK